MSGLNESSEHQKKRQVPNLGDNQGSQSVRNNIA
jgi:hypothetical protein